MAIIVINYIITFAVVTAYLLRSSIIYYFSITLFNSLPEQYVFISLVNKVRVFLREKHSFKAT